jgi:amino acid transporter
MTEAETAQRQPRLRRVMGPGMLLLFIVGDVLGTGVYALVGDVAAEVGGAAWVPFLLAFLIAAVTALSYLELVTKYPQAAGAALHAQKAYDNQFVTFVVAFVVMCAGITSASTAARFFRGQLLHRIPLQLGDSGYRRRCAAVRSSAGRGESAWCGREVQLGAPGLPIKDILPFISMVAVSNTALISILMASRLIYGMSRQRCGAIAAHRAAQPPPRKPRRRHRRRLAARR